MSNQVSAPELAFPGTRRKPLTPLEITFSPGDLSTPQQFGSNLLTEANSLTKHTFNKPVTDMIEQTPKSQLIKKPSSSQQLKQKRNILQEMKQSIQNEMDENGDTVVLQNRISWSTFDKIRKHEGLVMPKDWQRSNDIYGQTPTPKQKKHGLMKKTCP